MIFITFEGIEGSGKSTQIKKLLNWFKEKGLKAIAVREPGGTEAGERIREIILSKWKEKFPPVAELFLFCASRAFLVENLIKPALSEKTIVVCDRYFDSTIAYQGFGRGIDLDLVKKVSLVSTLGVFPDITFLIDVPPEVSLKRLGNKKDRIESEDIEFHKRVRNGFLEIATQEKERFVVIDGTKSPEEIHLEVVKCVEEKLKETC